MAVFLDTGFILALKNKDDKIFTITQTWMKIIFEKWIWTDLYFQFYTSTFVFDELVTITLVRIKLPDFAKDIGNYVLKSPRINIIGFTAEDFNNSWVLFQKHIEKRFSFTDCSTLVQCERLNCQFLATFDKHFKGLFTTNLA